MSKTTTLHQVSTEGNLRSKWIGLALYLEVNLPFLLCFTLYLRAIFQVQAPGGLYLEGRFNGGFFALPVWGAYIWRGLCMEGLIFGIFVPILFAIWKKIQNSLGFWIPRSGFRILCQYNLDSGFQSLVGFRFPWAVHRIPKPGIPDSTSKNFSDSGIRIPLHVVNIHFRSTIQTDASPTSFPKRGKRLGNRVLSKSFLYITSSVHYV